MKSIINYINEKKQESFSIKFGANKKNLDKKELTLKEFEDVLHNNDYLITVSKYKMKKDGYGDWGMYTEEVYIIEHGGPGIDRPYGG